MHLLSIETGRPHPAAAVPCIEVGCEHGAETPAQIFREKVVWQRCNANPQIHREVEVWNWQTGELLWVSANAALEARSVVLASGDP